MNAARKTKWIYTRIAEPFPVLWGHVSHPGRRPDECRGPFYAAGSEFTAPYTAKNLRWKEDSAEALRKDGWTVTVEVR